MNRSIKISVAIVAILFISTTIVNQCIMRSLKTEIIINAPVEEVWKVLMDHGHYSEWNPFIKSIKGSTDLGNSFEVTLQTEGKKPMTFTPVVLINNVNQEFRWLGKLGVKGVFDGEHYFILEQLESGRTKFVQGENFTGILSGLLLKIIGKDTENGFNSMNDALKSRVESNLINT